MLEAGWSTGNIAVAFLAIPALRYTGLDIDESAIARARAKYRGIGHLQFSTHSFMDLQPAEETFDTILFAGVFHHLTDSLIRDFLGHAPSLLASGGRVVVDPVQPHEQDPRLFTRFFKLEQGQFVRTSDHLRKLVTTATSLPLKAEQFHIVSCTPWGWPKVCRFVRYELSK